MNLFQFYWKYYTHLKYSVKKVMMMEPVTILFPGRPHHTALNTWIIFRIHFLNVHKLPLSIIKLFGAWKLQTHFVLMHACLERTTFFSLLINFILPKSCILCFNIKLFLLSNIHAPFQNAFSCIAAVSTTARKMDLKQCNCLVF